MTDIPFQLVEVGGTVVHTGTMLWYYVQPRIIIWKGEQYVLLSDAYGPGPGDAEHPNQYISAGRPLTIADD
jgi:hypothetical protein